MTTRPAFRHQLVGLAVAACFAGAAHGNPTGPAVANGSASFATSGNTLTVTNTPGTIINWQAFSIRPDEITRFIQSGAASAVLNRVTGGQQSALLGQLLSNGRVFLINPNGVAIGAGARIDTAGFVASSLSLSNEDFLAGRFRFTDPGNAGKVTNAGTINAHAGGPVYLVAPSVENHGVINAPNGEILLAAGKSVELVAAASPHLRVQVQAGGETLNVGQLVAESGRVGLYGAAIRNSGTISADSASVNAAGNVVLKASRDVTLDSTSVVTASGAKGGAVHVQVEQGTLLADGRVDAKGSADRGGDIKLLGERVAVLEGGRVDASGASGGGTILVGGDFQGGNATVQNAQYTAVQAGAVLRADATAQGDGGRVVVWADDSTRFAGHASARGGTSSGDGGLIETSGKRTLEFSGTADTSAANGRFGTLLLDPTDITIVAGNVPQPANAADGLWAFGEDPGAQTIGATWIQNTLLPATNVEVQATNNIVVNGAITYNNAANRTLTLRADNNITVNQAITTGAAAGRLGVALIANNDGVGTGNLAVNAAIATRGGAFTGSGVNVSSTAAGTITTSGTTAGRSAGNVTIAGPGGSVGLAGAVTASGANGAAGNPGGAGGTVSITGAGISTVAITASGGNGNGATQAGGAGGTIQVVSTGGVTTGALAASGGTAGAGPANGGTGGTISVANSGAGNLTTGALTARAGAATTTGTSAAGLINVTNTAAGAFAQTGAIDTRGNNNGAGGAVMLSSQGALQFGAAATIQTGGGAALANTAGRNGGAVTLNGATVTTTGAITTSGAAGNGAGQAGGNAGAITVTSTGAINVAAGALTASGGNGGTGNTNGGNAGNVALTAGTTATHTNITTTGGNRSGIGTAGAGGNVNVAGAALLAANTTIAATGGSAGVGAGGNVSFGGTVNSSGANRTLAVNTNGATTFGGAVGGTLALASLTTDAAGTTSIGGSVTTTGAQTYGDAVTLAGNATLTGTTPTFGSTLNGAGFDLALNFSGTTSINGANFTGIRNLSTANGGTTQLTGVIATSGMQTYGDAVTLTGPTTLSTANANITATGAVAAGANALTLAAGTGNVSMVNPGNNFATVVVTSGGAVHLIDQNALALGAVNAGTLRAQTLTGNLTLNGVVTASGGGDAIVLAPGGNLVNNAGAGALNAGGGRSLIYLAAPANADAVNGPASGNQAVWGTAYPTVVGAPGNRYVFANAPTITLTTTNAPNKTYGDLADVSTNYTASGFVNAATFGNVFTQDTVVNALSGLSVTSAGTPVTANAGTYTIVVAATATTGYTLTINNTGQLIVDPRPITITPGPLVRVYGDPNPTSTTTLTVGGAGLVNGNTVTQVDVASPAVATAPAGSTHALNASNAIFGGGGLASNYAITYAPGVLTIGQRAITVQANSQSRAYGDPNPATGPYTITAGSLAGADSITNVNVTSPATVTSGVGPYALTPTAANFGVGSAANYTISFADGVLTITPRPINVMANNQAKVYGQPDPALTFTAATVNGDVLNGALVRAPGESVAGGPYAITQGTVTNANNPNYLITFANGQLVITPAALTIAANNAARPYGDANPALTATYTGLTNGDGPGVIPGVILSTPAVPASNAGTYAINVASGANSNYTITTVNGQLVITPVPLTIAANDAARDFGQANPPFTATSTGFKLGQSIGDLNGTLAITTPATPTSPVGRYAITPSGVASPNYTITFVNGTLLVGDGAPPADPALITAINRSAADAPDSIGPSLPRALDCLVIERGEARRVLNRCY